MRKLLFLLTLSLLPLVASAENVEIDGIYYWLDSYEKTATVGSNPDNYSGNVVIPDEVTYNNEKYNVVSIGSSAFNGCSSLTSVTIPNSVTSIDSSAFWDCSSLTAVYISDLEAWCKIDFSYEANPLLYAHHLYLNGDEITKLVIPNSVTSIEYCTFEGCSGLISVTIPNNVTSIGGHAFEGCSGLTSVTIPNSVTSIGGHAFEGCSGLTSVTIPYSVTSIGEWAFCGCSSLASTDIPNSVTSIGKGAFSSCSGLTSITIPNSVTSIGEDAFRDCSGLTSVTIPNNVTSISRWAFVGCSGLISVTIPNSVTIIGDVAFSGCSALTSVTIPNSVTIIGDAAFIGCSALTSVTIGNSVTSIGEEAFRDCSGLTSVNIPNSVTSIGEDAFRDCKGLTSVTIGNGVTSISSRAFWYCISLTSVTIGNSVSSIGKYAFYDCRGLTSVTIPNSVISISNCAFDECKGLTSVTIGNSVTSIGDWAFSRCDDLSDVYCMAAEVPSAASDPFGDINLSNVNLYVPIGCKEKYAAVEPWSNFKGIIEIDPEELEPADLQLKAQEENGLVRLMYNAVPNDISNRITRTDANGANAYFEDKDSHYPDKVEFVDDPPAAGTYTYQVKMVYLDAEGEQQVAKSNKVTITIAEPQDEEKVAQEYGFITGRIECDKNPPVSGLKIKFSDGVTVNARGTIFTRHRIPVGEELTMTVSGDASHEYETATVEIKPMLNNVTIKGKLKDNYTPNENEHDLQISPDPQFYVRDNRHFVKITLYNPNENYVWEGSIIAELVHKDDISVLQKWRGERPTYRGEVTDIEISKGHPIELEIFMRGMKVLKESDFMFYLTSKGRWKRTTIQEEIAEKSIISTTGLDMAGYEVRIDKTESGQYTQWDDEAKDDFSYLIMGLSSLTPGMEGVFGDFDSYEYHDKMVEFAREYTGEGDEFKAVRTLFEYVQEWVGGKTALETLNEVGTFNRVFNGSSVAKNIFVELRNIFLPKKSILQKFRKDVIVNIDDIHSANAMMGNVLSAYNAVKSIRSGDTFQQIMTCASTLYGLTAATYVPLNSMMYTYGVAGKALINAAKQLQQIMHDAELPDRLIANNYRFNTKLDVHENGDPSFNTTCDFKLTVRNTWGSKVNFRKEKRNSQIKDITISASNDPDNLWVTTYKFDMRYLDDGIMLEIRPSDTLFRWGVKPLIDEGEGGGSNLKEFYMTIYWANDRITIIPLNQETNGVKIVCGDRGPKFDDENMKPSLYHVTLTTASGMDNMSDDIYLGSNKDRE